MIYVGVDVSKDSFDAYQASLGVRQFSNDDTGFKLFKKWIGPSVQVVMEASGPYYLRLATNLFQSQILVSVVNPLVIRRFCQMNLQRAKTDSKDAESIAQYAQLTSPSVWQPSPAHLQHMLQMQSVMEQLSKQFTSTRNAIDTLKQHPSVNPKALKSLQQVADAQKSQIDQLENEMMELAKEHYSAEFKALTSIPGIGKKTAMLLILSTNAFGRFKTVKQLVAYTGIAPRVFQSGKTINKKSRISKLGMTELRRSLFMCSLQAIKSNPGCKTLYDRLRQNGKAAKVALLAVCHKLLRQAFALVKSNQLFDNKLSLA
jgi:transposase